MDYSNVHRSFLQICAKEGFLEKSAAKSILEQIWIKLGSFNKKINDKLLLEIVSGINSLLESFDQKLVNFNYELDSKEYIVFSSGSMPNIKSTLIGYTPQELEFCRLLLEAIAFNPKHNISQIEATNLITEIKPKSFLSTEAEKLLKKWCDIGYLYEYNNLYYFGPRCVVEFNYYLKTTYKDYILDCNICNTSVFWGTSCDECDELYHKKCLRKYLKVFVNCPSCNKELNNNASESQE